MFKWLKTIIFGEPTGERARDKKGRYIADDKKTPNVNEAYKDGRKPTKRKKATPKAAPKKRGRPKGSKNKAT